jgi:ABC-type nitrate/sulfonate/bicarbonate transport system permease component
MSVLALRSPRRTVWSVPVAVQVFATLVALGLIWEILSSTEIIDPDLFSSPSAVWTTFLDLQEKGLVWNHLWVTTSELLLATGLVILVGGLVGIVLGASRLSFEVAYGPIATFFAFPKVTLFPIFITALGLGLASKVLFGALFGFFPLVMGTMVGVRGIRTLHRNLFQAVGASFWFKLTRLYIPATLPAFVAALRIGFVYAGIGILLAEMFAAVSGLGNRIIASGYQSTLDQFWVYVVLSTLLLMSGAGLLRFAEVRMSTWKED